MSSPGTYGGLKYESPTSRALGTITDEEYQKVYDDQAALTSKLVNDVSFIAANLRKVQSQADQADENVIQQLQDFINDIQVIMGGQGDTGFDFGDFKYVLQAYGALFDFIGPDGKIQTPVNLQTATQNFFNQYLFGGQNWQQAFDSQTDSEIATMLDILGEVPILNQAAQQLAVIISKNRDDIDTIANVFNTFFNAFNIPPGGTFDLATFMNATNALYVGLESLFSDVNFDGFQPIFEQMSRWDQQVMDAIYKLSIGDLSGIIGLFPISQLTNLQPNLQPESDFADSDSIASTTAGISWDGTIGRTALGSAKFVCDGTTKGMNGHSIAIDEGQTLTPSVWVKWAGVTSTGNVVGLYIRADDGNDYLVEQTNLPTSSGGWAELNGTWTNPTSSGILHGRLRVVVTSGATAGNVWIDDAENQVGGTLIPQDWVNDLTDQWNTFLASMGFASNGDYIGKTPSEIWNNWITEINDDLNLLLTPTSSLDSNYFSGDIWTNFLATFGLTPADVTGTSVDFNAIWNDIINSFIQPTNIFSTQDSVAQQNIWLGAALSGDEVNSGPWLWLAQIINFYYALTGQAHSTGISNSNILGIRNNQPVYNGLDNTSISNMPLQSMDTNGSAPGLWTSSAQSGHIGALVRFPAADSRGSISFLVKNGASNPTFFFVNAYRANLTTGKLTYLMSSTNLVSTIPSGSNNTWMQWVFPSAIDVAAGDVLAFLFQVGGITSGTFQIWGIGSSSKGAVPNHPTTIMTNTGVNSISPGSSHANVDLNLGTPSSTLWAYQAPAPYVSVELAGTVAPTYPPSPTIYTTGTTVQTLDSWTNFVDLVGCGQAGGGQGETGGTVGRGGSPGSWNGTTLTVGGTGANSIVAGGTITVTVQAPPATRGNSDPGSGGAYFGDGQDGVSTTFQWHDTGGTLRTLTCAGGLGGGIHNSSNLTSYGQGPGNYTFPVSGPSSETYTGGGAQLIPDDGRIVGGSGPGGQAFQYGFNGARGQAWVVERYT